MAAVIEQQDSGHTGTATPTSYSVTLPSGTTSGRTLVIIVASGATVSTPSGFTLDKSQVNNTGHYVFRKATSAAETSWTVNPTSGASGAWWVAEISGLDAAPLDVSASAGVGFDTSSQTTGTTSATTQANELAIGSVTSNNAANATAVTLSGWTNSFVEQADTCSTKPTANNIGLGVATKALSATGAQETTATLSIDAAATGIMVTYKESAGSGMGPGMHVTMHSP